MVFLFVQSQQWKYQKNVWNLFKVNNKYIRTTSITLNRLISHIVLSFPLLTLSKYVPAGMLRKYPQQVIH